MCHTHGSSTDITADGLSTNPRPRKLREPRFTFCAILQITLRYLSPKGCWIEISRLPLLVLR